MLRCYANQFVDWERTMPVVLFAMRTAISPTGFPPAALIYGEHIEIPDIFVQPSKSLQDTPDNMFFNNLQTFWLRIKAVVLQFDPTAQPSFHRVEEFPHKYVWVKEPLLKNTLAPKVRGPYEVVGVQYPVIYIKVDGTTQSINVDRCKPAYLLKHQALHQPLPETKLVPREKFDTVETDEEGTVTADLSVRNIGDIDKPYQNTRSRAQKVQAKQSLNYLLPEIFTSRADDE